MLLQKLFGKKNQNKGIVGISFQPQGIAVALAKNGDGNRLRLNYCEFIPTLSLAEQPTILRELVTRHQLHEYDCHVVLNITDYRRINIEAPLVPDNEMNEAIRWKITDLIDFPIDKATIDYFNAPESMRANSSKMLEVVVSQSDFIKALSEKSIRADLQLKVIDVTETVLRNLAVLLPENKRGVALLYLQATFGTILIQKEGVIYLSRNFDIGYSNLGLDAIDSSDATLHSNEQNNLALEVQRSLDYVESYYGMPPISGLVVVPLAEHTQNLLSILSSNHGITARIMDLTAIVDCDTLLDDATQSRCTPVIGATLRSLVDAL